MKIVTLLLNFTMLYSLFGSASAAPNITAIDTNQINLGKIAVHGNGFGAGPSINVYDDFEGGVTGEKIPVTNAKIGEWGLPIAGASRLPTFDNISHSGKLSARMYNLEQKGFMQKFTGVTEIFMSYWVLIPPGTPFPGQYSGIGKFSSDSSWKFAWVYDENYDGSDSDAVLPTHAGNGAMALGGNDFLYTYINNNWWDWDNWIRVSVWLKADESNPLANGIIEFQTVSKNKGLATQRWTNIPIFDADFSKGDGTKQFKTFTIPGWIRPTSSTATRVLYDDVYFSIGKNSAARIEIGDKPNYADSTLLSIQTPLSWTDNTITIDVRKGGFTTIEGAYLYVTDANGNVNSSGIKINSGMIVKQPDSPTDLIAN